MHYLKNGNREREKRDRGKREEKRREEKRREEKRREEKRREEKRRENIQPLQNCGAFHLFRKVLLRSQYV